MTELEIKLEKLRNDDIKFFAKRYAELFGKYFGKETEEEIRKFENEIIAELNEKVPKYIVKTLSDAGAMSMPHEIEFEEYNVDNMAVRIHELFHSYNHISKNVFGLRNLEDDFVLLNLDEGTTELFAQLIIGDDSLKNLNSYSSEVELSCFLLHLVGEEVMIKATRGNPELLSAKVDEILGTNDFLRKLDESMTEQSNTYANEYNVKTPVSFKMLSMFKSLYNLKNNDPISILYNAIEKTNNSELITIFTAVDNKYDYNYFFSRYADSMLFQDDSKSPVMADVEQEILLRDIQKFQNEEFDIKTEFHEEILKFLYDKIEIQRYFLGKTNYKYGVYQFTEEDIEYCKNFESNLDLENKRLGGQIGIVGVGCRIYELDNIAFKINQKYLDSCDFRKIGVPELNGMKMEIVAEYLLVNKQLELLKEYKTYLINVFLRKKLVFAYDTELEEVIDDLIAELEIKKQGIIDFAKDQTISEEETQKTR